MTTHGKWSKPGVPLIGWTCVGVEDLGEASAVCEMCETQEIRYVHSMSHPDYAEELQVGCVCAGRMENDYIGPRSREKALRSAAGRKKRWLGRKWKISARGNPYLNTRWFQYSHLSLQDRWLGRPHRRASVRVLCNINVALCYRGGRQTRRV